jgi:hypothetical protein
MFVLVLIHVQSRVSDHGAARLAAPQISNAFALLQISWMVIMCVAARRGVSTASSDSTPSTSGALKCASAAAPSTEGQLHHACHLNARHVMDEM